MKYRVLTFRSKPVINNHYKLLATDFYESVAHLDASAELEAIEQEEQETKLSRKEKRALKKQMKKNQLENRKVYIIDDEEVYEEDLTKEELAEIQAQELLNVGGFYDALEPIDADDIVIEKSFPILRAVVIGLAVIVFSALVIMAYVKISAL